MGHDFLYMQLILCLWIGALNPFTFKVVILNFNVSGNNLTIARGEWSGGSGERDLQELL